MSISLIQGGTPTEFPAVGGTPLINENFESYADGDTLYPVFFTGGFQIEADSALSYSGTKSCKVSFNAGGTNGGGYLTLDTPLVEGEELWIQFKMYMPTTWRFNNGVGFKILRVLVNSTPTDGHVELYNASNRDLSNGDSFYTRNEVTFDPSILYFGERASYVQNDGQWHTFEVYIKLDSSVSATGTHRIWIDGNLEYERDAQTIGNASDTIDVIRLATYFNPTSNEAEGVADATPSSFELNDASGNFTSVNEGDYVYNKVTDAQTTVVSIDSISSPATVTLTDDIFTVGSEGYLICHTTAGSQPKDYDQVNDTLTLNYDSASGSPQAQSFWVDELLVYTSTSPPVNTDAGGNVYIG